MPNTKEHVFAMKAGTEVPKQFDGITIPILAPANNAEMLELAGDNAYVIFNRAYVLDVQKAVKVEAVKEGATVDKLRAVPASYKIGSPKTRSAGTGKPRVAAKAVHQVLGDDFLKTLTPEQLAIFNEKMASLKPVAKAAETPAATPPAPAAKPTGKPK